MSSSVMPESAVLAGLTAREASIRLESDGPNEISSRRRRSLPSRLLSLLSEPTFALLLIASALYFAFGNLHEAVALLASFLLIVAISLFQEGRTERALEALRALSSPKARVLRDGTWSTIPAREVVRGDVVALEEGDRIPADGRLVSAGVVTVDESLLTGESATVQKHLQSSTGAAEASDATVHAGTLVVAGHGTAVIERTGARSEFGKLGASLDGSVQAASALRRGVTALAGKLAVVAGAASLVVFAFRAVNEGPVRGLLAALTLAISLVPEEYPVVLTVFLALGAWRLSRVGVLTRKLEAIETLGSVHVLCTDKTGTLTRNQMRVRRLVSEAADLDVASSSAALPEAVHELLEFAVLASPRESAEPMESAFRELLATALAGTEHEHPRWTPVREYPLRPELLAVTHAWEAAERSRLVVATKGAPEAVFDLCHLEAASLDRWRDVVRTLASQGLRVLGVARNAAVGDLPELVHDIPFELLGVVGLEDPLRPGIDEAVAACGRAGVRVIMITGDHRETAIAIAKQAGLAGDVVLSGADIERMNDAELGEAVARASIVSRAVPAHKLRIVQALRASGNVVAMTGDGVNDAPALRAADVGIAMGARGTEVAREAAALVLQNDDFGSIVAGIRSGRRIYANLENAFAYIFSVHLPIASLSLIPAMLGWPVVLTPLHVVLIELVIDPACSVVLEQESTDEVVMSVPPRPRSAQLLGGRKLLFAVTRGLIASTAVVLSVYIAGRFGAGENQLKAVALLSLLASNLGLLVTSRNALLPFWRVSWSNNRAIVPFFGFVVAVFGAIVLLPILRGYFQLELPTLAMAACAVIPALPPLLLDVAKSTRRQPAGATS